MTAVKVNRKAADRIASGHPWIFSSDVTDRGSAQSGETVAVVDPRGRNLGNAHYSSTSQITLRLLPKSIPGAIGDAAEYRKQVVRDTDAFRLVHAEADLLPGLIIDRYSDCFVVQLLDQGMDRAEGVILDTLEALFQPRAIVARNDVPVRKHENLPLEKKIPRGELAGPVEIRMNGLIWSADLLEGQKTGVFLDQRENYTAVARYAKGRALDCFTSTGGFALHMAARCESVEAVDSSAVALATARTNASANNIANVITREANAFDLLASYSSARRRFDAIVLDPPAFAKSRTAIDGAIRGYREINLRALQLLNPGGILVSCSCSHHVPEAALLEAIAQASLDAGRTLRVLERRTQAQDHPILLTVPETHYLKCLILQVI
jgi:23S rRNA (cytosine1962-C5)-methyltransferase